jgi:hypothetical protein
MKEQILKIANDLRDDIITADEAKNLLLNLFNADKWFLVTYKYTDRTDAALHEEAVEAKNCVDACNKVYENHNYKIEWHAVKEII